MNDIVNDVIHFAINRYLMRSNSVPYDAVVEASRPEFQSDLWTPVLVSLLTGHHDYFRKADILTSDPVTQREQFEREIQQFHVHSVTISSVAGMLCEKWYQSEHAPWTSDQNYRDAVEFIKIQIENLA